jgi:hypothetical protein
MKIQLFAMINKIKNKESKNEKNKCPTTTLTMGDIIRRKKKRRQIMAFGCKLNFVYFGEKKRLAVSRCG